MIAPVIGMIASTSSIILLVLLYRLEARRGTRFLKTPRMFFDRVIIAAAQYLDGVFAYVRRDALRGSLHYLFHKVLVLILSLVRGFEQWIKTALVRNKETAHRIATEERTARNKLDEIQAHKQSVALTEEEKQKHKEDALLGKT
ncbi:MAG: hypothetical protein LR017_01355 [Candidatus Pacebacteria bacterium]|nr:hypothetical protein [Candidatus Paceibacterota bacterium]